MQRMPREAGIHHLQSLVDTSCIERTSAGPFDSARIRISGRSAASQSVASRLASLHAERRAMAVAALTAASKMSLSCWRRLRSAAGGGGGDLSCSWRRRWRWHCWRRRGLLAGGPAAVLLERARWRRFWFPREKATKPFSGPERALWGGVRPLGNGPALPGELVRGC